jgi:hypothetical protein
MLEFPTQIILLDLLGRFLVLMISTEPLNVQPTDPS